MGGRGILFSHAPARTLCPQPHGVDAPRERGDGAARVAVRPLPRRRPRPQDRGPRPAARRPGCRGADDGRPKVARPRLGRGTRSRRPACAVRPERARRPLRRGVRGAAPRSSPLPVLLQPEGRPGFGERAAGAGGRGLLPGYLPRALGGGGGGAHPRGSPALVALALHRSSPSTTSSAAASSRTRKRSATSSCAARMEWPPISSRWWSTTSRWGSPRSCGAGTS